MSQETNSAGVPEQHVEELTAALAERGCVVSEVGDFPTGLILNVAETDGTYMYTITLSRTEGY